MMIDLRRRELKREEKGEDLMLRRVDEDIEERIGEVERSFKVEVEIEGNKGDEEEEIEKKGKDD